MSPSQSPNQDAHQRLQEWRQFFLDASSDMLKKAGCHEDKDDYISAYLCLWVAFENLYNLYSFHAKITGSRAKMKEVIKDLSESQIDQLLNNPQYVKHFNSLNERKPIGAIGFHGLLDMQSFFDGEPLRRCVKNVTNDGPHEGWSLIDKQDFLDKLATELLYTVRNNLFHAIKGPHYSEDQKVVKHAYYLLKPLMGPLLEAAKDQPKKVAQP